MSFDRYADVSRCLSIATIDVFRSLAMPFDRFRSLAMSFDRFRTRTPLSPSRAHDRIIAHADASSSCGSCLRREDRMPVAPAVEPVTRSRYRVKNSHSLWTLAGGRPRPGPARNAGGVRVGAPVRDAGPGRALTRAKPAAEQAPPYRSRDDALEHAVAIDDRAPAQKLTAPARTRLLPCHRRWASGLPAPRGRLHRQRRWARV